MKLCDVSLKDFWNRQKKLLFDPVYAFKHKVKSSNPLPVQPERIDPYPCMVDDPMLNQARADEAFYIQQLNSGYQVYQSGNVETAADADNLHVYQDSYPGNPNYQNNSSRQHNQMQDPYVQGFYGTHYPGPGVMPPAGMDPMQMMGMPFGLGGY